MSTRERWIVYPLLFLALGTSIKPKIAPPTESKLDTASGNLVANRITCRRLFIVDDAGEARVRITGANSKDEAEIQIIDRSGQAVVRLKADAAMRAGLIETLRDDGQAQAVLTSSATGGEIQAFDNAQKTAVLLGHYGGRFGLIETNLKSGETIVVPISKLPRE